MSMICKVKSIYETKNRKTRQDFPHPLPCLVGGAGRKGRGRIIYHVLLTRCQLRGGGETARGGHRPNSVGAARHQPYYA